MKLIKSSFKTLILTLICLTLFTSKASAGIGLIISEFLENPAGTDSPFEYVELKATKHIDFSVTPYSVVVCNNGTATASGWVNGLAITYGFNISTGVVNAGDVVYVGGTSMAPTGIRLRAINTGTTTGDGFGAANASGVFGNGGTNADGIAVFSVAITSITNSTVPDDAIFYGTGFGTAIVSAGAAGYQLPINDLYSGGKLQSTSFLGADPGSLNLIATGVYDTILNTFSTPRTWNAGALTDGSSTVTLAPLCVLPTQPSSFTTSTSTVNQGQSGVTYTVPNDPTVTYNWTYSGSNTSIVGTGNSVTLNFGGTATSGTLSVTATNICGTSTALTLPITVTLVPGAMRITEYMYNGGGAGGVGEFVEFTNVGSTTVDMTGWSFDDNSRTPGSQSLSAFGIVQPGESVIITEIPAATFRTNWALCNTLKVIGGSTNNLGREDEINLYDASNTLVDRLTYGDQTFLPGSIRTTLKSGWVNAAGLGTNTISNWTLSAVADAEGSYNSTLAETGNPGKSNRAIVFFDPCVIVNGAPTIVMDVTNTTNYLDAGLATSPVSPYGISGVINDPTDPASTLGIDFTINDAETSVGSLTVTATSGNTSVVPNANLVLSGSGASRNIKITPTGVGYAAIAVTVNDGTNSTTYTINFAASIASTTPTNTFWHTGISDASDGIAIDDNYYISGDDELNVLNVYARSNSGLPLTGYDYTTNLSLPDLSKPEVDLEAATNSTSTSNKIYWLGSMSNGKGPSFSDKPNRNRIFATTISGTGAATTFTFAGYYGNLRDRLIQWGDANGYNFTASAAAGVDSKSPSGFAAEGMVFGPDNTTLYIGMRAPLVPTATRTKAVIAPISNFETWFNNGSPVGNPTFASPIELDLGGRGFRDLTRLSNGTYIIVAGNPAGSPVTSAIYKWSGNPSDAPILVSTSANGILNLEGVMQVNTAGHISLNDLQVISDGGDEILYADGSAAKDLADLNIRKFRSDKLTSINLCLPTTGDTSAVACSSFNWYGTNYTSTGTASRTFTTSLGCDSIVTLHLTINPSPNPLLNASGPVTFCQGSSVTLSVASGNSYQWQMNGSAIAGETTNTYVALADGNYNVIITNASGCSITSATQTIVVNTLPDASVSASGSTTFCQGGTVNLTAPAGNTYQWSLNGSAISGATSNSYTAIASGNYNVVVTTLNGCSSTSTTEIITVNPLPTATITAAGPTTFCIGNSVTLNSSPGTSYQWLFNGSTIGGATSSSYSANATGNYAVIVTNSSGCSKTSSPQAIIVNPLPLAIVSAGGPTTFCQGDFVSLSTTGGTSYQWLLNGNTIAGATSNAYVALASGNYSVLVTNAGGCTNISTAQTVSVNALPVNTVIAASSTSFCDGDSVVLAAASGLNYQWLFNGSAIPGATTQSYTALVQGNYNVQVTDGVCSAISANTNVTVNPLPTANLSASSSTTFCQGNTVTLNASGGINYQWVVYGALIGGATSTSYNASTTGNYAVIAYSASGCSDTSTIESVLVHSLPDNSVSIIGSTNFCIGDSVILSATNGFNYQWLLDGTTIPGATQQNYTAISSGNYTVLVDDLTCSNSSTGINVTANSLPSTPVITQSGSLLTATFGSSYQWYLNDTLIVGATSQNYTAIQDGDYTVEITNIAGCSTISSPINFTTTGILASGNQNNLSIFPNPFVGQTTIQVQLTKSSSVLIEVYSVSGAKVAIVTNENYPSGNFTFTLDLTNQNYGSGLYLVKSTINNNLSITKIVKNN